MTIIEYRTATADNPENLDTAVNRLIEAGFQPLGIPLVIQIPGAHLMMQTTVKYKQSPDEVSTSV